MEYKTYTISETMGLTLSKRLFKFRSEIGKLPEELIEFQGLINRKPEWFDPVRFLEIFPTINLRPGYTLNYFYLKNDQGGRPILYTRKIDKGSLSKKEMDNMLHHMTQTSEFIKHLEFERSPLGFFHFAVFNIIVHQFYTSGQSKILASSFIFDRTALRIYLLVIKKHGLNNTVFDIDKIKPEPLIKIIKDYNAEVTLTLFSESSGISYNKFHIEWPCSILKTKEQIIVKYEK